MPQSRLPARLLPQPLPPRLQRPGWTCKDLGMALEALHRRQPRLLHRPWCKASTPGRQEAANQRQCPQHQGSMRPNRRWTGMRSARPGKTRPSARKIRMRWDAGCASPSAFRPRTRASSRMSVRRSRWRGCSARCSQARGRICSGQSAVRTSLLDPVRDNDGGYVGDSTGATSTGFQATGT